MSVTDGQTDRRLTVAIVRFMLYAHRARGETLTVMSEVEAPRSEILA